MRIVSLAACLCVGLCIPIWLSGCDAAAVRSAQAGGDVAPTTGSEKSDDSVAALRHELKRVSRRLRDLEYPELRARDPREVEVLQALVIARQTAFKRVKALRDVAMGTAAEMDAVSYNLAVARADLAWAKRDVRGAVKRLGEAADITADMVRVLRRAHETGLTQGALPALLDAQTLRANAQLALIRAEKVAAVAKVDIRDIQTDRRKLSEQTTRGPAQ